MYIENRYNAARGISMKLYSRGQVIFFSITSGVIVLLIAIGFGFFGRGSSKSRLGDSENITAAEWEFDLQTSIVPVQEAPFSGNGYTSSDEDATIKVYELLNKGVVNITTEIITYNWFLDPIPTEGGTGSGSIIDKRGYILTNYHVIENATKLFVTLADAERYEGEVIGIDPENDLAVIKIDPGTKDLTTIPLGTSEDLRVGQKVLAIGNPFGFDRTLTTGIVSGLGRPIRSNRNIIIQDMIQTDAAINPGNSGGPLLNSRGQMIGINTMIFSPSQGSVGVGFAVPVDTARRVVPELIEHGLVDRGWIDIVPVQLNQSIVNAGRIAVDEGLLISRVTRGGNAEAAGLRGGDQPVKYRLTVFYLGGDVIVKIDNTDIKTITDLFLAMEDNKPGETVEVEYYRGRQLRKVRITLSHRPEGLNWE